MKTKASVLKNTNTVYEPPKKIAVINDLSGYGHCSLTVAMPIISALGIRMIRSYIEFAMVVPMALSFLN